MTGYELCELVVERLREEPQNYCQLTWVVTPDDRYNYKMPEGRNCGTAYCIGGWMRKILGVSTIADVQERLFGTRRLLDPNAKPFSDLTDAEALGGSPLFEGGPRPGTRDYAELGIAHLQSWMRKHEDHLKNTKVA